MKSLIFLLTLLIAGCAHGPRKTHLPAGVVAVSQNTLPNGLGVEEFRLTNGMRVLLVADATAPVFNYQLWVHAGSLTEVMDPKLKRAGMAHLFEHMMFRGTPKNPGRDYDLKMSAAGGNGLNATTSYDRTNYFVSLPRSKLDFLLEIEADRFQNLAIDETMFKNEIGAVLGELKMGKDRPGTVGWYALMELAFPTHPYGKEIIGEEDDLKKFTVDEANYFYRTYYAPNNYTLVLVGDIDKSEALQLIVKYFGASQPQALPHGDARPEPAQAKARRKTISHPAAQNDTLYIAYKTQPDSHADTAALTVLAGILGSGEGSILQKTLVDAGLASSVSVANESLRQAGILLFVAQLRPGVDMAKAKARIDAAVERMRTGKVTEAELTRARNLLLLDKYYDLNDNQSVGDMLADGILLNGDYMSLFRRIDAIKQVSRADVVAVAKKYLVASQSNLLHMVPEKKHAKP